jgi:hypothetical protein
MNLSYPGSSGSVRKTNMIIKLKVTEAWPVTVSTFVLHCLLLRAELRLVT